MDAGGLAIGAISLGIDVCKGLIQYLDSYKSANDKIDSTRTSVENLRGSLVEAQRALDAGKFAPTIRKKISLIANDCDIGIRQLIKELDDIQKYAKAKSFKDKVLDKMSKLQYPFKEGILDKLERIVRGLQHDLNFLLQITSLEQGQETREDVQHNTIKVAELSNSVTSIHLNDLHKEILKWLNIVDPGSNHNAAQDRHESETGAWLANSNEWRSWVAEDNSFLWLNGKVGCGKTLLCFKAIEEAKLLARSQEDTALAYFYFDFREPKKQNLNSLLCSLVKQVCWNRPIPKVLEALYKESNGSLPSSKGLDAVLQNLISQCKGPVYLIVDALDESPLNDLERSRAKVLQWMLSLHGAGLSNLHFLVTSRPEQDIKDALDGAQNILSIAIEESLISRDISRYIESRLAHSFPLKELSDDLKDEIKDVLTSRAQGMFRWVFCQMHALLGLVLNSPAELRASLRSLPETLDETYERILDSIPTMYQQKAHRALQWIMFSPGYLFLDHELIAEACLIEIDQDPCVDITARFPPKNLFNMLGSLVVPHIDYRLKKVHVNLAHFSVEEYLTSGRLDKPSLRLYTTEEFSSRDYVFASSVKYIGFAVNSLSQVIEEYSRFIEEEYPQASKRYHSIYKDNPNVRFDRYCDRQRLITSTSRLLYESVLLLRRYAYYFRSCEGPFPRSDTAIKQLFTTPELLNPVFLLYEPLTYPGPENTICRALKMASLFYLIPAIEVCLSSGYRFSQEIMRMNLLRFVSEGLEGESLSESLVKTTQLFLEAGLEINHNGSFFVCAILSEYCYFMNLNRIFRTKSAVGWNKEISMLRQLLYFLSVKGANVEMVMQSGSVGSREYIGGIWNRRFPIRSPFTKRGIEIWEDEIRREDSIQEFAESHDIDLKFFTEAASERSGLQPATTSDRGRAL